MGTEGTTSHVAGLRAVRHTVAWCMVPEAAWPRQDRTACRVRRRRARERGAAELQAPVCFFVCSFVPCLFVCLWILRKLRGVPLPWASVAGTAPACAVAHKRTYSEYSVPGGAARGRTGTALESHEALDGLRHLLERVCNLGAGSIWKCREARSSGSGFCATLETRRGAGMCAVICVVFCGAGGLFLVFRGWVDWERHLHLQCASAQDKRACDLQRRPHQSVGPRLHRLH